jgi:hypothetical protein
MISLVPLNDPPKHAHDNNLVIDVRVDVTTPTFIITSPTNNCLMSPSISTTKFSINDSVNSSPTPSTSGLIVISIDDPQETKLWPNPMRPVKLPVDIPNLTLIGYLTGKDEATIFRLYHKTETILTRCSIIMHASILISFLALCGIISPYFVLFGITNYASILIRVLFINTYLAKEILCCFETWFLSFNMMILTISLYDMLSWSILCMAIGVGSSYWIFYLFFDAIHISSNKRIVIFSISMCYSLTLAILIYFEKIDYVSRTINIGGYISYTTKGIVVDRLLTTLFFDTKHLAHVVFYKNAFVILKSRLTPQRIV